MIKVLLFAILLLLPAQISIWALAAIGLTILTGITGILNLGIAAFIAIGAYAYGISTANIYPMQFPWYLGLVFALFCGALSGFILGLPTLRLRGDYLAIVTLGFGEIIQDILRNLEVITKGTQGINPLPNTQYSSLICFALVLVTVFIVERIRKSHFGRMWSALRDDELAASSSGINPAYIKIYTFSLAAAIASLAGALWAMVLGSTGEPSNYDFQVSIMVLAMVILGGLGNLYGAILGAILIGILNSYALDSLSTFIPLQNCKYLIFGLTLVLVMRFRNKGLLPA